MIRKRLFQVLRSGLLLLCIGILYSIFLQWTGIGLICPVYFLTGQTDEETIRECLELHPAGYLVKPVAKNALLAKMQEALGR